MASERGVAWWGGDQAMICKHCLYEIALSSTDSWRLSWNPDDDAAPYECTEHEEGHEPADEVPTGGEPGFAMVSWGLVKLPGRRSAVGP